MWFGKVTVAADVWGVDKEQNVQDVGPTASYHAK